MSKLWKAIRALVGLKLGLSQFQQLASDQHKPSGLRSAKHLWRMSIVTLIVFLAGQTWWPRSVTAQPPRENTENQHESRSEGLPGPRTRTRSDRVEPRQRAGLTGSGNPHQVETPQPVRPNRIAQIDKPTKFSREGADSTGGLAEETMADEPAQDTRHRDIKVASHWDQFVSPQGLKSSGGMILAVTILSLAPAILMMSTCFIRFVVVLSLLRQALGTPNLPPNQVLMGLSLCLTFLVMGPVWSESYKNGIRPYVESLSENDRPSIHDTFSRTVAPLRRFMSHQIEKSNNADAVWMFVEYQRPAEGTEAAEEWKEPETYDDVSLTVLLPAYVLSELKTAFLIGFQIYLPFLIIDLVVAAVLVSMGISMLAPAQVSLPFKLLLFVLIDGWTLTVGMLVESVRSVV